MAASTCQRCRKIFNKVSSPICRTCEKLERDEIYTLNQFIVANPTVNVAAISNTNKIPAQRILQYVRSGKVQISEGMSDEIRCIGCGKVIITGNFCNVCILQFKDDPSKIQLSKNLRVPQVINKNKGTYTC